MTQFAGPEMSLWSLVNVLGLFWGTLLAFNPVILFRGNPEEIPLSLATILLQSGAWGLIALGLCLTPWWFFDHKVRSIYLAIWTLLALVFWANSSLLLPDLQLLTGKRLDLSIGVADGLVDVLLLGTLVGLAAGWREQFTRAAGGFILILNVGYLAMTLWGLSTAAGGTRATVPEVQNPESAYRFSQGQQNVMAILMDSFQGDVFHEVVTADPHLLGEFEGFTFYQNGMGVARTTYLSMPAVWSGEILPANKEILAYRKRSHENSFVHRLLELGVDVTMVKDTPVRCPQAATCATTKVVQGETHRQKTFQVVSILDLSLLRAVPRSLKAWVYNDESWRIRGWFNDETVLSHAIRDNRYLEHFANRIFVQGDRPTFKWLYLYGTHVPTNVSRDCTYEVRPLSRDSYRDQSRCALEALSKVFQVLRRQGIYHQTAILLISDHGMSFSMPSALTDSDQDDFWRKMAGSANPTIAIKPYGARGDLRISTAPVQLTGVGATVCAFFDDCDGISGEPFQDSREELGRSRTFLWYPWTRQSRGSNHLEGLQRYSVRDHFHLMDNWTRIPENSPDDLSKER